MSRVAETVPIAVDAVERQVLESADWYLENGLALKSWYEDAFTKNRFGKQFDLARSVNRPEQSFGFFDHINLRGQTVPIMGNYQEMFYDRPRVPDPTGSTNQTYWQAQLREFVLHYFMRVSSFTDPAACISSRFPDPTAYRPGLSWCQSEKGRQRGFGFTQLYCKEKGSGDILKFAAHQQHAILDLREIAGKYEWLVLRVQIFDFQFKLQPFGDSGPNLGINLNESSYLVLSPRFVINNEDADGEIVARYGFGYAFIRNPVPGITAYGPGEFDGAFESIEFALFRNGEVKVRMAFVANRPVNVVNVGIAPLEWGYELANAASLGLLGHVFPGLRPKKLSFDPVYAYISLANLITSGQAGEMLCISKEQLDKRFLLQHFVQHYETLLGSLTTWRQIPDWLDEAPLPRWVVTGLFDA